MMGSWNGWRPGFGWIFMLLFWGLVALGIAALAKWIMSTRAGSEGMGQRPLDILKQRYARGEVTREQYEQMRRDLE